MTTDDPVVDEAKLAAADAVLAMLPADAHEALREALHARVTGDRNGSRQLRLFVPGRPAPQGSKDFKGFSKTGKAILKESSDAVGPWRERVALAAADPCSSGDALEFLPAVSCARPPEPIVTVYDKDMRKLAGPAPWSQVRSVFDHA
ncbi:putative resolvase [Mycobacterium phage 33D]|nr:putative resolvase [Mycobacterium phage 33D]